MRRLTLDGLEKRVVTREWIDWYREEHKSRAREVRLEGGLVKPRHPHWNLPFCNICDMDFEVEEEFYLLYVGGMPWVIMSTVFYQISIRRR